MTLQMRSEEKSIMVLYSQVVLVRSLADALCVYSLFVLPTVPYDLRFCSTLRTMRKAQYRTFMSR